MRAWRASAGRRRSGRCCTTKWCTVTKSTSEKGTPTTRPRIRMSESAGRCGVRIPRFRECFNLLSVFLSLLSTRVQLVHVWRVLDVIGWLRMPHSAAPTCRVLLHARLRRQRVLPSLSVCLTVLQETWLNPLLALVTTKRLRAHHMLKASPNHTASHLSICRMYFRLQGQVGETAKTRVQHIQAAQLSCPSWPPAVPSPAPDA